MSHDTAAVLNLSDRVIWLRDGEIAGEGPAEEVTALYLEDLHYEGHAELSPVSETLPVVESDTDLIPRDMRQDFINTSQYRNDIEIFDFIQNLRAFGTGQATVVDARFFDTDSNPFSWIVDGEKVRLTIKYRAIAKLTMPIVGFEVYDRLGQTIFRDNTYLTTRFQP